ncbi:MAG: ribonuclease HI family protein [Nitrospirota bacterium]
MADDPQNKNLQQNLFETPSVNMQQTGYAVMYCDGASSGNPGHSGIGVSITLTDEDAGILGTDKQHDISEYIGEATNNVAEYSALIKGLETARELGIRKIKVYLDSELLVRQMSGVYKVKNKNLISLWKKAKDILKDFDSCNISHVRRELNKDADALARKASLGRGLR